MIIGYLSADFHSHAVAYLIAELIEKHDRSRFAIHGYSYGPDDGSAMRGRLVRAFDRFVDVRNLSHLQAAQRIAGDEVQILVDLTGYTKNARTRILASSRPHPGELSGVSGDDGRIVHRLYLGGRLYSPLRSAALFHGEAGAPARLLSGQ